MGNTSPIVAVDVMGSDLGPEELLHGVKAFLSEDKGDYEIVIVGNEEITVPIMMRLGILKDRRIKSYNAKEVITMEEKPIQALKQKKDASMMRAIEIVKIGTADAVLSCGNTGALMAGGTIKLRTMAGIERPALGTVIPGKNKNFIMIDVGASPDPKPESLVDNAILGVNYARVALGVENPVVGLLSNGTEDGKGNMLVQTAHRLFRAQGNAINYGGLLEGFNVFDGDFDVIVCDGFTGNVVLKSLEGSIRMFKQILKEEISKSWLSKLGILLALGAFKGMRRRLPVDKFSGAPLLGLNGLVVKAHGSSNRKQIAGALEITIKCLRNEMHRKISEDIAMIESVVQANKRAALEKQKAGS